MMILASMITELAVPDLTSASLLKRFQKIDPDLGVMDHDAEV
jgi:hypothetical protein